MSLRLIYGRAGTGKSEYCFKQISKMIQKEDKIYMITPEQFSFTAERKLLDNITQQAVVNAEVLTFNRMAYRVINEVGGIIKTNLSKSGKAMLIYNILNSQKDKLTFLGKSKENIDLIGTTITELKKHKITKEDIEKTINKTQDKYLKIKLQDIYTLYESFNNEIQNKYIDEDDILTILEKKLEQTDMFDNSVIYIDEFVGFTKQEYELLQKLLKKAKQINIVICTDDLKPNNKMETDIFYENKQTVNKLLDIAKKENIKIEEPIHLEKNYRFKNIELSHLEKNIYETKYKQYKLPIEQIELFLAKNQFSEIENVANKIVKLTKEQNYKYSDISVITKNISTYQKLTKAIFAKYNIPIFIDEKKDLNQNILVKYIISLLEIFSKNWSYTAMFNYLKSGLSDIEKEDIFLLENYCIAYGIKANKWYKEEWKHAKNDEELEKVEALRKRIVEPLMKLKNSLNKIKSCKEISEAIYNFLIKNDIDKKLNKKIKKLEEIGEIEIANEYKTSWNTVIQVLDELVLVLKDTKISFEEYMKTLKIGLQNSGLGKIPATCDEVIMGDIDRSRTHKVKAVFIIGLNDGVFPSINKEEGFLNDNDRKLLKEKGLELAKGTQEKLYEDNFNIYKAFSIAEEKLYLSYSASDSASKALRPSILISKIKKILVNLKENSDIINIQEEITTKQATFERLLEKLSKYQAEEINPIWFEIYNYYNRDEQWNIKLKKALQGLEYTNQPIKLSKNNIEKLYGNTLKTSISKLEQYKKCAFSFYLKYGLQLQPKENFKIQSLQTGNFMHEVIDQFFDQILQREINLREISQDEIEGIIQSIINEKLTLNNNYIFTSIPKYKILSIRLKQVIIKSIKYIIQTITDSEFEIFGNEVEFKKNAKYPPIVIQLEEGKKVEITGKIDRIDITKQRDGNYLRIIDYKSSAKDINLNEVIAGLQIQLLTYLDAVNKLEETIPAGVLYFNLFDPIIQSNKNMTDEEIEDKIKREFRMKGLILADVRVVRMMDKNLQTGSSNLVPAYIDTKENLSSKRSSTVTKEEFEYLQKYMNKIIKQISEEILTGNIDIKPSYNNNNQKNKTPCNYCEYKSICNFNPNKNAYNYVKNREKEIILDMIKQD